MSRPVAYSQFLTDLAIRIQKTQKRAVKVPTLLAGHPNRQYAIVTGVEDRQLHVFDRESGRIHLHLPLPPMIRSGMEFRHFEYDSRGTAVCAYHPNERRFVVWSLREAQILNVIKGEGKCAPTCAFVGPDALAVSDGPKITMHRVGGEALNYVVMSRALSTIHLYAAPGGADLLLALCGFVKDGYMALCCFHIQRGEVVASGEGPVRQLRTPRGSLRRVSLVRALRIKGAQGRVLVLQEEESADPSEVERIDDLQEPYATRLTSLDPTECRFHEGQVALPGRFALEYDEEANLSLIDQWGRRRRVEGPPVSVRPDDWRLAG